MKRIVIDLDHTLSATGGNEPPEGADATHWKYEEAAVNLELVQKLRDYKQAGFDIVIHSSRNMRTYEGNVGLINVHTLPRIIGWLERHDIPFDEVIVGKPWCGTEGFYVDDRSIRPLEFQNMTYDEIVALLEREKFDGR